MSATLASRVHDAMVLARTNNQEGIAALLALYAECAPDSEDSVAVGATLLALIHVSRMSLKEAVENGLSCDLLRRMASGYLRKTPSLHALGKARYVCDICLLPELVSEIQAIETAIENQIKEAIELSAIAERIEP